MPEIYVINIDLAKVKFPDPEKPGKTITRLLGWGDEVEVLEITDTEVRIKLTVFQTQPDNSVKAVEVEGIIAPRGGLAPAAVVVRKEESKILKLDFVDVQQGDGSVIETPAGKTILVDGGDNQLFARYLANRFRGSSMNEPCKIDCILVTHGDADHFLGLTKIHESETLERLDSTPWKRLFICPERVYHNGLVKRPGTMDGRDLKDEEMLGATETVSDPETGEDVLVITGLEEDLLAVDDAEMNAPFKKWKDALTDYNRRLQNIDGKDIEFRRLEIGDAEAFDFLDEEIEMEVLGPIPIKVDGADKSALKFLHTPPKGPRTSEEFMSLETEEFGKTLSASHTINGHSVVFMLRYGGFTFLFSGDLNDEAERVLTRAHNSNEINLQADVFKVPHHGSHDFSGAFVQAVAPIISVVSSGDESARKEYIHPRATLLGALGRYSRIEEPIIFITELVAFFQIEGWMRESYHQLTEEGERAVRQKQDVVNPEAKDFYSFSRAAFGIIMVRTDGERLLVYTNSALEDTKEAYAFRMNEFGKPEAVELRRA